MLRPDAGARARRLRYSPLMLSLWLAGCGQPQAVWIAGWQQTSPLSIHRAGTAVVAANGYLYVIGGVDGRVFLDSVEYARINKDGTLGPWQAGPSMNEARGFTSAAVRDGSLYVVGGGNGPNGQNLLRTVERARLLPDGKLGPWVREQNQMVLPRRCSKVLVDGKTVYSFGGFGGALLDTVEHAEFLEDGTLGPWQLESGQMTLPRYTSGVNLVAGKSVVIGGHHQSKGGGITDVEWSPLSATGHAPWRATNAMQEGRFELTSVAYGNTVYAMGGISNGEYLDSIEFAEVAENSVSKWQYTTTLSSPRASFSAVVADEFVYVIGGTNLTGYFNSVEYARINTEHQLGYWGTEKDKAAHEQQIAARKVEDAELPNQGVVWEIIQTSGYTYVHTLSPQQGEIWLAGNKLEGLQANDNIEFSTGVRMSNFYSKELKRAFPLVLFVGTLRKVE